MENILIVVLCLVGAFVLYVRIKLLLKILPVLMLVGGIGTVIEGIHVIMGIILTIVGVIACYFAYFAPDEKTA